VAIVLPGGVRALRLGAGVEHLHLCVTAEQWQTGQAGKGRIACVRTEDALCMTGREVRRGMGVSTEGMKDGWGRA
jgi:hypothetical protein